MRELFDKFAAVAAALTASLITLSVCHEFGYFIVVGRHFQTFLGPADYLANAILWMPLAAISLVGWVDWRTLRRVPELPSWKEKRTWVLPGFFLAMGIVALIIPHLLVIHVLNFIYVWAMLFDVVIKPKDEPIIEALRKLFKYTVPIGVAMVALGYGGAKKDLIYPRDDYVVQIKGKDGDIERSLLRSFGRGILVLDRKSKTTEFWQWDVISSIRRRTSIPSQQSFSCEWFKFNCYSALEKPRV